MIRLTHPILMGWSVTLGNGGHGFFGEWRTCHIVDASALLNRNLLA